MLVIAQFQKSSAKPILLKAGLRPFTSTYSPWSLLCEPLFRPLFFFFFFKFFGGTGSSYPEELASPENDAREGTSDWKDALDPMRDLSDRTWAMEGLRGATFGLFWSERLGELEFEATNVPVECSGITSGVETTEIGLCEEMLEMALALRVWPGGEIAGKYSFVGEDRLIAASAYDLGEAIIYREHHYCQIIQRNESKWPQLRKRLGSVRNHELKETSTYLSNLGLKEPQKSSLAHRGGALLRIPAALRAEQPS